MTSKSVKPVCGKPKWNLIIHVSEVMRSTSVTTNYLTIPHSNVKVTFAQVAETAVVATTALHKTSLNDRIPSRYDIKFVDIIIKEKKEVGKHILL